MSTALIKAGLGEVSREKAWTRNWTVDGVDLDVDRTGQRWITLDVEVVDGRLDLKVADGRLDRRWWTEEWTGGGGRKSGPKVVDGRVDRRWWTEEWTGGGGRKSGPEVVDGRVDAVVRGVGDEWWGLDNIEIRVK